VTQLEQSILEALNELDARVRTIATANPKPNLQALFAHLDDLASRLPKDADPTLRHYLTKKSYEKARWWLTGRDAENERGICR